MSDKTDKNWSTHIERIFLIFTLIGGFYLLDGKIESLTGAQTSRTDLINTRIDQANARTDQLYTMFIDLLKEGKNK